MARNPIQFQHGLSLPAFLEQNGTDAQCQAALFQRRLPKGFVCPDCGNTTGCRLSRGLYQCHRCNHQTSLTNGIIFLGTHLPLTTLLLAMYLLTQRKNGLSALQLSRELGVSYSTAWKLKHKILQVMLERNQGETLSARIVIDDAYLSSERSGKTVRGAEHESRSSPRCIPMRRAIPARPTASRKRQGKRMKTVTPRQCHQGTSHPAPLSSVSAGFQPCNASPYQAILRYIPNPGEVFRRLSAVDFAGILADGDIQWLVEVILDKPMLASRFSEFILALNSADLM